MLDHANLNAMCRSVIEGFSADPRRPQPVDPAAVPRQRDRRRHAVAAAGRRPGDGGRALRPEDILRQHSSRAGPTYFSAVPTIYTMLCGLPDDVAPDTSSVRFAVCGAAPASVELLERFESRFGIPIIEGYGLSEGTCASAVNPLTGPRKPGTVGLPLPGQTIRIVDEAGRPVPDGEAGEVVIKGANVMRGYLNRPEETAKTIVDGWLHTGDVGRLDEDGYLVLVDRTKDMIIRGGENIYPRGDRGRRPPSAADRRGRRRRAPAPDLRRGAGRCSSRRARTRPSPQRRFAITSPGSSRKSNGRSTSRSSTTCPRTPSARSTSPLCAGCWPSYQPRHHIDKRELIMSFTKPEFPAGRSRHLLGQAADGTDALPCAALGRVTASGLRAWCMRSTSRSSCSSTPRWRVRRDGDVGSAGVLACRGVVEPADRLPEAVLWTVLLEAIGVAGSWGPLAGKVKPMTGGILFWLRPGTIRLRPWKWVPFTDGDRRTWFDVILYFALLISLAVPLLAPGVHSDSLSTSPAAQHIRAGQPGAADRADRAAGAERSARQDHLPRCAG